MNKRIFFVGIILFAGNHLFGQAYAMPGKKMFNNDSIQSFSLQFPKGEKTFLQPSSKELTVIAFLSPECPLCKNYSSKLVKLRNKYYGQADFVGVIPGTFEGEEVIEFQKNYMPSWKLLRDTSLSLTHYLNGEVTPEVMVIDNKDGLLIYKGAIDNWLVSLGKTRNKVTDFYLDVALNNFFNDKPAIPFTKPVGCIINDF